MSEDAFRLNEAILRKNEKIVQLEAEIKDIKDAYAIVMNEECASDEVHCTCVPALRAENQRLTEAIGKAISGLSTVHAMFNSPQMDNSHVRRSI